MSSGTDPAQDAQIQQDIEDLRKLGYSQQLFREMGGFSNFAISFSIISILTGAVLLFGYGLKFAGPIINSVGWPVVSLFTLAVAASMAELASAYPTAGGLYFWAFRLGGRSWAWVTAWLNMVGQVTITAGVNVAAAMYLIGAITRIFDVPADVEIPLFGALTNWYFTLAVMVLLMIPQVLLNIYGIKIITRLNNFSVYWHIGGVVFIALMLTLFGKHHNDISFLFQAVNSVNPLDASSADVGGTVVPALVVGTWTTPSPLFGMFPGLADLYKAAPFWLFFMLGTLQAQWTFTGYDASAHTAEETVMARKNSAWGVFLSVAVSSVVGYVLLMILTWCIPNGDVAATAADGYPVLYVAYNNLVPFMAHLVAVIIGVAMWLCGAASITSMARMWYAFARDDGMPMSSLIKQISPTYKTPIYSILITSVLSIIICLYSAAYFVVTSISTITLYLAYVIPIYLNWRNRRSGQGECVTPETAPWNLGNKAPVINLIAMGWVAVITVIFCLPPNELVLWTMVGLTLVMTVLWFGRANAHFTGPKPDTEVAIKELEQAG